jgi:hypothetical protein
MLEIDYFLAHPAKACPVIREIICDNSAGSIDQVLLALLSRTNHAVEWEHSLLRIVRRRSS